MSIRSVYRKPIALLIVLLAAASMLPGSIDAAPIIGAPEARLAQANVDWMSADQAAQLDLGFPVLVPSWIPVPFGGAPSVQGGGGYYSLYWMIAGGDPTFLQITGEVGGAMPVGSPADLNVRLEVNASVNGYDAMHDVTSIYDNVWWVQGGVLYTVSSKNMTGTDSLSLANSLVQLEQAAPVPTEPPAPAATEPPAPTPVPADEPTGAIYNASEVPSANIATIEAWPSGTSTLRTTHGAFADSGAAFLTVVGGSYAWRAPSVDSATTVEFTLVDDASGQVTAWSSIRVYPTFTGEQVPEAPETDGPSVPPATEAPLAADTGTESTALTTTTGSEETDAAASGGDGTGTTVATTAAEEEPDGGVQTADSTTSDGGVTSDGTAGPLMPRTGDGTAGPSLPRGGDGTGGIRQIVIP